MFKDVQVQQQQQKSFNSESYSSKNITKHGKNHLLKMEILKLSVLGHKPVEIVHLLAEIYKFHKHITLVYLNQIIIESIVDNIIHHIIKHNFLLTTNADSIVIIEEHNKLLPKLIMIGTKL